MAEIININKEQPQKEVEEKEVNEAAPEVKKVMKLEDVLNIEGVSNFEEIAMLLSLPDKDFDVLSGAILLETEKAISDSNNLILLKKEMETYGLTQDELVDQYANLMAALDMIDMPKNKIDFLKRYIGIITNAFTEGQKASKRIIEIPIELIGDAKIPKYAHVGDAGIDVYAFEDYDIEPGETVLVKTGIKVAIPLGFELQVRPRSGSSLKTKLRIANAPGTIDSSYRGEICIIMENIEPKITDIEYDFIDNPDEPSKPEIKIISIKHGRPFHIDKGERIAQLVLNEIPLAHFYQVDNLDIFSTERGEDGFGSSGTK
jgi:dUTP pyrophosphatase